MDVWEQHEMRRGHRGSVPAGCTLLRGFQARSVKDGHASQIPGGVLAFEHDARNRMPMACGDGVLATALKSNVTQRSLNRGYLEIRRACPS